MASTGSDCSSSFPQSGIDVSFQKLTVTTRGRRRRELVHSANGCLRAGQLAALLGPSGAGKTSLMDALAGRTQAACVSGGVWFGGRRPTRDLLQRTLAYVEQEDTLVGNMTVHEMLSYTLELRSPPGTPVAAMRQRVEAVLTDLGLQGCRDTLIGGPWQRGVSGGERRRTSVGVALVAAPAVIFLDECTSGLDSSAALNVIGVLRAEADRGATVLASVHQPSSRLLALFDVLLMAAEGHLVYQGPNGAAAQAALRQSLPATAARLDDCLDLPCWLLDCLEQASKSGELAESCAARSELAGEHGKCSLPHCMSHLTISSSSGGEEAKLPASGDGHEPSGRRGILGCYRVLVKYRLWADYRSPVFLLPRIADKLGIAIFLGTLYLGKASETTLPATFDLATMLFVYILLPGFAAVCFIPSLMLNSQLFVRERHAGLYPILSYLLCKMSEELLVLAVVSPALSGMVWALVGLAGNFFLFWLPYLVGLGIGVATAYLCAALSPTLEVCIILLAGYVISVLLFTGLSIQWTTVPAYWSWYGVLSWMRYGWGAVMINQFSADPRQIDTTDVLSYFSLDGRSAWGMLGIQFACFLTFVLLAWGALWAREALPRWSWPARQAGNAKRAAKSTSGCVQLPLPHPPEAP